MKRRVVAVVDDDLRVLGDMGRSLPAVGYDVERNPSADELREVAILTEANCCIIDIKIGESSGIDLVLDGAEQGSTIPTIFMSGDRRTSAKCRCRNKTGHRISLALTSLEYALRGGA